MVKHIVFFNFKDKESMQKSEQLLKQLPAKIDCIRSMEVGIDKLRSERSFDMALICTFDSFEDLEKYDQHPEHLIVRDYIKSVRTGSAAVDFEYN